MLIEEKFAREDVIKSGEISFSIYLNEIPAFVEAELERLYGSVRCSLSYIRIFKTIDQVSTFVAWNGATPTAILLFRIQNQCIFILNEHVRINEDELRRCVEHMFERFPSVGIIRFETVFADLQHFSYPFQHNYAAHAQEVAVVNLPASADAYTSSLGSKTRTNIKYCLNKLKRDFPSFRFQSYEGKEIDEQFIRELIRMKEARLTSKKVRSSIDKDHEKHMIDMSRMCGVLNVIWINDRLSAGSIGYRVGRAESGELIVHDPQYNSYSLGKICVYLSLCQSISKGVKRYYLGAGKNEYKYRLSAVADDMKELEIYRSPGRMVLHGGRVARTWCKARKFELIQRLNKHRHRLIVRYIFDFYSLVRHGRQKGSV